MTKFDRYLLLLFAKIFTICFCSFTGLYLIVHLFTNFDEILSLGKQEGNVVGFMQKFYGPRILDFFDRTVGMLVLIAAVFAFAFMQRRRELTAIEAAGIPRSRMVKPLVVIALIMIVLSIVNREVWIPKYRKELTSTAQNWNQEGATDSQFQKDHLNGLLIRVRRAPDTSHQYKNVVVQIPIYLSDSISRIVAARANYVEANEDHPAGLLLESISEPLQPWKLNSLGSPEKPVVYFPNDRPWLTGSQCFVATHLTTEELAYGQQLNDYSSLSEMVSSLHRPTQWFSRSNRIAVHSRIVRPLLDMALLLIALPFVIRFSEHNLLLAAASCAGTIAVFQIAVVTCQTLGSLSLIRAASLAAWLPVILFVPLTPLSWRSIDR
ncbi:MAG: LptF/LptG family permease [Pirellulaceae bacterium]